jgi:hypothetical protein
MTMEELALQVQRMGDFLALREPTAPAVLTS